MWRKRWGWTPWTPAPFADRDELLEQAVAVHRQVVRGGEERLVGLRFRAGGEVFPDGLGGAGADRKDALFVALAEDFEVEVFEVQVADPGGAELFGAQAGVEQEEDDGAVAVLVGEGVEAVRAAVGVGFGAGQGGEHGADVGFAEGLDGAFLGAGALDRAEQVGGAVALG